MRDCNRATHRRAEFVLPVHRRRRGEEAARIENVIAQVIENRAVKCVRPRLARKHFKPAAGAAIFRAEIAVHQAEFRDGFHRWIGKQRAAAFRAGCADAIEQHFLGAGLRAIDLRIGCGAGDAGREEDEALRITHVAGNGKREIGDEFLGDAGGVLGSSRVDDRRDGGYVDNAVNLSHLESDVERDCLGDVNLNPLGIGHKVFCFDVHTVKAYRELRQGVDADRVARRSVLEASGLIDRFHRGANYHGTRLVRH